MDYIEREIYKCKKCGMNPCICLRPGTYDIRKNTKKSPAEFIDSEGNILWADSQNTNLKCNAAQKRLEMVGYDGPNDWKLA